MFTDTDRIRKDQIDTARRTLTVPEGRRPAPRPSITQDAPRTRHIPKGHDAILKAMQDSKAEVTIITAAGGETYVGTIFGRDKFTITLLSNGIRRVFYKHDISQFFCRADATEQKVEA